jgi:NADPH2:quinone reductase
MSDNGLQLRSAISEYGVLTIDLAYAPVPEPADDEVVIRVEAALLNPSDMALLTYPADPSAGRTTGSRADTDYTAEVPAEMLAKVKARRGTGSGRLRSGKLSGARFTFRSLGN